MGFYLRPTALVDALAALAECPATVLAGGTDFYPARVGRPLAEDVLDITALDDLRGIGDAGDHHRIGATTTWSELVSAPLPAWFDGLKLAAREIGGAQIQNAGTIAGNLCNASPAADGVPALLVLDAGVELRSHHGARVLPLGDFILGNRRTARRPDELMTAILVPKPRHAARATFMKLGARKYLVISIVVVAAVLEVTPDGAIARGRIAVGACSEVARRLPALEAALVGRACRSGLGGCVAPEHLAPLAPIGDVRGTAAYRRDAARVLVARVLEALAAGAVA